MRTPRSTSTFSSSSTSPSPSFSPSPSISNSAPSATPARIFSTLDEASLRAIERYRRAVNYLAAAQIYLRANPLLEEPLRPEHIKERLLGHWGTAPGINLVFAHLNRLILRTGAGILLITGPGHGAAANLANLYLEGTLAEFYPELTRDREGLERLLRYFSWPDKFPSHLNPALPGVIHEGGELGYALATAFGAALDNPDLLVACIVGDGESETGPTAAAWHASKFLNPATELPPDERMHLRILVDRPVYRYEQACIGQGFQMLVEIRIGGHVAA